MSTEHRQRASDADRHELLAALQQHTAAGRLTLDEYADRVDRVLHARTHGDLAAVVDDLPAAKPAAEPAAELRTGGGRQLLLAFLLALLALVVIGVAVAAFR